MTKASVIRCPPHACPPSAVARLLGSLARRPLDWPCDLRSVCAARADPVDLQWGAGVSRCRASRLSEGGRDGAVEGQLDDRAGRGEAMVFACRKVAEERCGTSTRTRSSSATGIAESRRSKAALRTPVAAALAAVGPSSGQHGTRHQVPTRRHLLKHVGALRPPIPREPQRVGAPPHRL